MTVGNGMEQETWDELVCIERHNLLTAAMAMILPTECDAVAFHADEAGIGDGNAMGIAPGDRPVPVRGRQMAAWHRPPSRHATVL